MGRIEIEDVEVVYEVRGAGDPVVAVHASPFTGWYVPLVSHLTGVEVLRHRRTLRRAGAAPFRPLTVAEDAATCARLMDAIG